MSAPTFAWAMERGASLRLSPAERLVLLYLADMANGERVCWPGQETIVRFTGLALRTVRTVIPGLVRHGLIQVESRPGVVTRYHILRPDTPANGHGGNGKHPGNMSPTTPANGEGVGTPTPANRPPLPGNMSQGNPGKPSPGDGANPGKSCTGPRQMVQPTPANRLPDPLRDPKKDPRKEEHSPLTPLSPRGDVRVAPPEVELSPRAESPSRQDRRSYPADFDAFWLAYPRKAGKRAALKGWAGAVTRAGGAAAIMAGLASHRFAHEERYIPHPSTWLNRDQWLDEHDSFDPVLRAVGLTPEDLLVWPMPEGRLLQ